MITYTLSLPNIPLAGLRLKITTLIPLRRNDGSKVSPAEVNEIVRGLWVMFHGVTREGKTRGDWIDPKDGRHYHDTCEKVVIETDRQRLVEITATIKAIGRRLGQKAMYMEVQYYDGVQFLRTDD